MRGKVPIVRRPFAYVVAMVALLAVVALFLSFQRSSTVNAKSGGYRVNQPGIGAPAPEFSLESSTGGTVRLADYRGKNVLLFFQEGISCQPCWDQIKDLERNPGRLKSAGIDAVVSVTGNAIDLVTRKAKDDGLSTPVLADPRLSVSRDYNTVGAGMMGSSANGHSFILVGPDGTIVWRADYGAPPKYTMYVPLDKLFADLARGRRA